MQLAKYRSHKTVYAGEIVGIPPSVDLPAGARAILVENAEGTHIEVICAREMFSRFVPSIGDYLVVYEDGYMSFSPAKAFEDGYARQA